jgi:hypothetical protein
MTASGLSAFRTAVRSIRGHPGGVVRAQYILGRMCGRSPADGSANIASPTFRYRSDSQAETSSSGGARRQSSWGGWPGAPEGWSRSRTAVSGSSRLVDPNEWEVPSGGSVRRQSSWGGWPDAPDGGSRAGPQSPDRAVQWVRSKGSAVQRERPRAVHPGEDVRTLPTDRGGTDESRDADPTHPIGLADNVDPEGASGGSRPGEDGRALPKDRIGRPKLSHYLGLSTQDSGLSRTGHSALGTGHFRHTRCGPSDRSLAARRAIEW